METKAHERKIVNADLAQTSSEILHTKDRVLEKSNTDPKARLDVKDVPDQHRPTKYKYNTLEELMAGFKEHWRAEKRREEAINMENQVPEKTDMDTNTRLETMETLWYDRCKKDHVLEENNVALQKRLEILESLEENRLSKGEALKQRVTYLDKQLKALDKYRVAKEKMLELERAILE